MAMTLMQGAIARLCGNKFYINTYEEDFMPVLHVYKLTNNHVCLSDGMHFHAGLLRFNLHELSYIGKLQKGLVVRLTKFEVDVFIKTK